MKHAGERRRGVCIHLNSFFLTGIKKFFPIKMIQLSPLNYNPLPPLTEETSVSEELPAKKIPFNNLYLLSGLVHGFNKGWMYVFTLMIVAFGYLSFQLMIAFP